jgi:ribosomal protein L31E
LTTTTTTAAAATDHMVKPKAFARPVNPIDKASLRISYRDKHYNTAFSCDYRKGATLSVVTSFQPSEAIDALVQFVGLHPPVDSVGPSNNLKRKFWRKGEAEIPLHRNAVQAVAPIDASQVDDSSSVEDRLQALTSTIDQVITIVRQENSAASELESTPTSTDATTSSTDTAATTATKKTTTDSSGRDGSTSKSSGSSASKRRSTRPAKPSSGTAAIGFKAKYDVFTSKKDLELTFGSSYKRDNWSLAATLYVPR